MNLPKYPEPGQALVLVGPQGCGKRRLARMLAEAAGKYIEIEDYQLPDLHRLVDHSIKTVIVEGWVAPSPTVKRWIAEEHVSIRGPYSQRQMVIRTPRLIFCTSHDGMFSEANENRRFVVFEMKGGAT